ncbi:hypothetical protein [Rhizobium sp. MHM7A]|uniref:hypothetical protein n=1 Tax=Rhizobium sp. MHM7A TaxID=2583233 RepID=UPI001106902B|nr:hypothetical protein [Rhizobium sp. MHM7A]TLX17127.1 hypothetical protein FFR93_07395 [Rhizobium sp. MHM7A]
MTPNEIYALPSLSSTLWYKDFSEVLPEVLNLEQEFGDPAYKDLDTKSLLVHTKLGYTSDGSRTVTVFALTFEDKPFAVMFTGGRGGRDRREYFVTDTAVWKEARGYVQSLTSNVLARDVPKAQADVELISEFYDTTFVKAATGYLAVNSKHAHPVTGALIYDQKQFTKVWRETKQDGLIRAWNDPKEETPEMRQAALEAYQAGVVGKAVQLNTQLSEEQLLFAASAVDGITFAYVVEPRSRYAAWGLNTTPWAVGPASMLECYAEIAAGRPLDPDLSYIRDLVKTFDVSPEAAVEVATAFITAGGKGVAERLMAITPRDDRIPEEMDQDYSSIALAYRVIENHDVTRFCPSATNTWATELVEKAEVIAATMRLSKPSV